MFSHFEDTVKFDKDIQARWDLLPKIEGTADCRRRRRELIPQSLT